MIVAWFNLGPFDGRKLALPCEPEDPWRQFVIPRWDDPLVLEVYYLRAGRWDEITWTYIWDDAYSSVTSGG